MVSRACFKRGKGLRHISHPELFTLAFGLLLRCRLREFVAHHHSDIADTGPFNTQSALNTFTIQEFEELGTAAVFGFKDRLEVKRIALN